MDKFGVPKKVNRNVIKAIYKLNYQGLENPNLSNICDLVELSMKNNVPVPNLQSVVRQSLQNLYKLGIIEKKGTYYYITRTDENVELFPPKPISPKHINTNIFKKANRKEKESSLNPNNRKRVVSSEDSIPENDPKSSIKRFRTSKTLSRKGRKVDLPKVRVPPNIDNYQLIETGEMELQLGCSSSFGNDSEDDEPVNVEEKGFAELFYNGDNLAQSLNDSSHKKIDSQTQTYHLNKCYDAKIRINKLDILNVNESQLDEGVENKNISLFMNKNISHSEYNKPSNEQQKESIVLDIEQVHNINDGSGVEDKNISHLECNQTTNEKQKTIVLDTEQNYNINDGSQVENENSSHLECNQTANEKQKELFILDTEQNHNINDGSTDQTSRSTNENQHPEKNSNHG